MKPTRRPANPCFSSGPCAKRPGWSPQALSAALVGRSHRSAAGLARLVEVVDRSRAILGIPADWRVGIVAGSDTGAIEIAMWSLLGARGVDMLAWENFGEGWVADVAQLKLADVRVMQVPYGRLPDLSQVDPARDVVFPWNGTTSGVRVPNGDWIAADRQGLTICDATSAIFAMRLPWDKLDVATWSWQKSLGGEGGHGMLALSPRAVERLESHAPPWPLPKLFRLTSKGKLIDEMPVAGSLTLKPSRNRGVSCARAPPSCIRPSGPRMTDGRRGSDSRALNLDEGSRATVAAVSVWPSSVAVGVEGVPADATTVAVSVACAIASVTRSPSARRTRAVSKPSSDTAIVSPRREASISNVPSAAVVTELTWTALSKSSTVAPGSGSPV